MGAKISALQANTRRLKHLSIQSDTSMRRGALPSATLNLSSGA